MTESRSILPPSKRAGASCFDGAGWSGCNPNPARSVRPPQPPVGMPRLAQAREPAKNRVVQDPGRVQQHRASHPEPRPGRHRYRLGRKSCAGRGPGGRGVRHRRPDNRFRAHRHAAGEAGKHARLRCRCARDRREFRSGSQHAYEEAAASGRVFIEPFDDWRTIAGQGTIGLEMLDDLPSARAVITPVGGGGLIAGIALAVDGRRASAQVHWRRGGGGGLSHLGARQWFARMQCRIHRARRSPTASR